VSAAAASALGADFSTMSKDCVAFDARSATADTSQTANGSVGDTVGAAVRPAGAPVKQDSIP
jgi:hypothetical protein